MPALRGKSESVAIKRAAGQVGRQRHAVRQVGHRIDAAADAIAHGAGLTAKRRTHRTLFVVNVNAPTAAPAAGATVTRPARPHTRTNNRPIAACSARGSVAIVFGPAVVGIGLVDVDAVGERSHLTGQRHRGHPGIRELPGRKCPRPTRPLWRRASGRRDPRSKSIRADGIATGRRRRHMTACVVIRTIFQFVVEHGAGPKKEPITGNKVR